MNSTPIPNHVEAAINRLLFQYKGKPRIEAVLRSIVQPIQDLEDIFNDMEIKRALATAAGVQLDNIGKIVGLARFPGDDDETYRRKLYARIKINTSNGQPEQAIQTFQLFTNAVLVLLSEEFPGEVLIGSDAQFADQEAVDTLLAIMEMVLPAGVRMNGFVSFDPDEAFAFAGALPGMGWGDSGDPSVGGKMAGIHRRGGEFAFAGATSSYEGFGSTDDPLVGGRWVARVKAPYFLSASVPSDGDQVIVQLAACGLPPLLPKKPTQVTGFIVKVNTIPVAVSAAIVDFNTKVFLTLASTVLSGDTVTVEYSPGNLTDSHGTALAAFAAQSVQNDSTQ